MHPKWCRAEKVQFTIIGTPEIEPCEADVCQMVRGQWKVNDEWMVSQASLMEALIAKVQELKDELRTNN